MSRRLHLAIGTHDLEASIEDYSERLGCRPVRVLEGEVALWQTDALNVSARVVDGPPGVRHLGFEDPSAEGATEETDVNGVVWERFRAEDQAREIDALEHDRALEPS